MKHVKETEIIAILQVAKLSYDQALHGGAGQVEVEGELAEEIVSALTQAMDIIHDYEAMAKHNREMIEKYEKEQPVIKRGVDFYQCPACGKRTGRNHSHCHWCGKKLGWNR